MIQRSISDTSENSFIGWNFDLYAKKQKQSLKQKHIFRELHKELFKCEELFTVDMLKKFQQC